MSDVLPTMRTAEWTTTAFFESLKSVLGASNRGSRLRIFMYAITSIGWQRVKRHVTQWRRRCRGSVVEVYVGTDHGLTDGQALEAMREEGLDVFVLENYVGVYHPKVVWLEEPGEHYLWVASNNLTDDGLLGNIELAALLRFRRPPGDLSAWASRIADASVPLSAALLDSYRRERREFDRQLRTLGRVTFTWSGRKHPRVRRRALLGTMGGALGRVRRGDLILEIMPKETGAEGSQVQIPVQAARSFFRLRDRVGASKQVRLQNATTGRERDLTLTLYRNRTTRLSLSELEPRHRPCVVRVRHLDSMFRFEIIDADEARRAQDGSVLALGLCSGDRLFVNTGRQGRTDVRSLRQLLQVSETCFGGDRSGPNGPKLSHSRPAATRRRSQGGRNRP